MKHGGKGLAFKSRIGCGRVGKAVSGEGFFLSTRRGWQVRLFLLDGIKVANVSNREVGREWRHRIAAVLCALLDEHGQSTRIAIVRHI